MVRLFHLNHGCKDCQPGHVYRLLPIKVAAGSPHADEFIGWKQAFPAGLSVFGYRHMTNDQPYGEVPHTKVTLEWDCEQIRQQHFPHMPSRFQAFFGFETIEEAIGFRNGARAEAGAIGSIWEIAAERVFHRGDMRLLVPGKCPESNLLKYWQGEPLDDGAPIWECLVVPPVTMVRCVIAENEPGF